MYTLNNKGVCAPKGFKANGIHCGIRKNKTKKDLSLIYSEVMCSAASIYTLNKVKGAPIAVTKKHIADGYAQAILVNSGNANTCNVDGEDIANKIINHLPSYEGFDDFCMKLKSKDLTYTRISRMLLHVLLDFKKADLNLLGQLQHAPYARILGFRKESGSLLHEIKEKSSFPLISKLADASKLLSAEALYILEKDISSAHIYEAVLSQKSGSPLQNEYKQPIIIV